MQRTPEKTLLVGIDPGVATGYAEADATGRLVAVESLAFWEASERLQERAERVACVVVEDARRVGLYSRHDALRGRRRDAAARSVGRVDRDVTLWLDLCERLSLPACTVEPTRSKWDARTFRRVTGWAGRTNEHARDAARLVYGMSAEQALLLAAEPA